MLTESSAPGNDYLAEVCVAWEKEAQAAEALGMRVVRIRTGLALDARGGALPRMLPPFRMGVGGKLAGGRHWMSWIHLDDLAGMIQFALTKPVQGAVNGVAPNPVTNADFTRALAAAVHRPAIIPVPAFGLKLLFGEMSEVLLASQRVAPQAALSAGFQFRFPQLDGALAGRVEDIGEPVLGHVGPKRGEQFNRISRMQFRFGPNGPNRQIRRPPSRYWIGTL